MWKDFSELASQLTEAESRFEKKKRLVGLFLGPLCFLGALLSPPWENITPVGMRTLGIFALSVIWWITEAIPIPVTSLLVLPLIVVCGILPTEKAFGYWSHWINMFLLGTFVIGHAMDRYGLTRRFSLTLVASSLVRGNPWRLLVVYLLACTVVTAFISNVVTAVLFLSMGVSLLGVSKIQPGSAYGMAMFLGIAWATNIGGTLTPSGSPTNMIAIGVASSYGYRIGYLQWILANLPFAVLQLLAMFLVLRLFLKREDYSFPLVQENILGELNKLGPFSRGEKIAAGAMGVALALWILPDLAPLLLGKQHPAVLWMNARMNWGVVALLVAGSLFVIPVNWKSRQFAMTWDDAVKHIEWGTMALAGGALAVGELVGDKKLGLGEFFSQGIASLAGPQTSRFLFILIVITIAVLLTNLTTNVAVISATAPIILNVAPALGLNPIALMVTVAIASCIGYATPMANPPCAIIFASGYIRILPMFQRGALLSAIGIVLLAFAGYPLANRIFPWPP